MLHPFMIPKNVWMSINQFVRKIFANVVNVKVIRFRTNLSIEDNMEQHVAQFLADFLLITFKQGISEFKRFFNRVGAQAF